MTDERTITVLDPERAPDDTKASLALHRAETILAQALAEIDRHGWRAIMILYTIYEHGLWKSACDDDGVPFTNFERYIQSLAGRIPRLGIRWAQEMISAVTICRDVLGFSQDEITACSPAKLREIKKTVRWDQKSRRALGYNIDGGKDAVISLVRDAASPDVRYTDVRARVRGALKKLDISYAMARLPGAGAHAAYRIVVFHDDLSYDLSLVVPPLVPDDVLRDLKRRLGVPD
jgi:hypothetical protein